MIASVHIITGAAMGVAVERFTTNPAFSLPAAFIAGFISHHVLDLILHTDLGSWRKPDDEKPMTKTEKITALIDNIIGTAIVLLIFSLKNRSWPMLFGASGGNMSDVFHHTPWWSARTRVLFGCVYYKFHRAFHFTARGRLIIVGIFSSILVMFLSLLYILK